MSMYNEYVPGNPSYVELGKAATAAAAAAAAPAPPPTKTITVPSPRVVKTER